VSLPFLVPPHIWDCRVHPAASVLASAVRGFSPERLREVEEQWTPARLSIAERAQAIGTQIENFHWRWTDKDASVRLRQQAVLAIEAGGETQGLLAINASLRASVIRPGGWVVYVDYIETAPWNLIVPGIQTPRFAGVGSLLIGEAIRASVGTEANGSIGLHSLPQAENFYRTRCRMTQVGQDPLYGNLVYFEYQDSAAALQWLAERGRVR